MTLKKYSHHFFYFFFAVCFLDLRPETAQLPASKSCNASSSMLMSSQVPENLTTACKNLTDTVVSYPIRGMLNDGATTQQGITNRANKLMPPAKTQQILAKGNFSVLPAKLAEFANYPAGAALFPGYADVATTFDAMVDLCKSKTSHVALFRKIHINALCELYHHLMGIYVNFNLQQGGISQSDDGTLHVDVPAFLQDEKKFDANKKTLIINHLINIIESQFNSSIRSYVPNIPQMYASSLGKTLIQNDYSSDLSILVTKQTNPKLILHKKESLQALATYLKFFQTYTGYLQQKHPKKSEYFTAFVDIAEGINQYLYGDVQSGADKNAAAVAKMNPPLFSFTYDDIRALKMIPFLVKNISASSQKVGWPEHLVQAANEGLMLQQACEAPHPIAYFRTKSGIVVKNPNQDATSDLYICMRNGVNLFEELLIAEPAWMNSWDGVVKIMRGCFGDFSALIGLNILDPCMESLIRAVMLVQKGGDPNSSDDDSLTCTEWLQTLQNSESNNLSQNQVNVSGGLVGAGQQISLPGVNVSAAALQNP